MNEEIVQEVYANHYMDEMPEQQFRNMLLRGLQLVSTLSDTDRLFISRFFQGDDLKSVNIALTYNQELMIKLLTQ